MLFLAAPGTRSTKVVGMRQNNLLGEYLRECRERVSPADVGLQWLGPRRVAGLRHEEVALLACIRANCYLRLQPGQDRHTAGAGVARAPVV